MDYVTSQWIARRLAECEKVVKQLLADRGIQVARTRFALLGHWWPIHLVSFEHTSMLGFFREGDLSLGINREILRHPSLNDTLEHELAHYLCFIHHGTPSRGHGQEFRETFRRYQFSKDAMSATASFDFAQARSIQSKIDKLLRLSEATSEHEAQSALRKAQDLMSSHGMTSSSSGEQRFLIVELASQKRSTPKLKAISEIFRELFVFPVLNHRRGEVALEITCRPSQRPYLEYLYESLSNQFERLWKSNQMQHPSMKGAAKKNAFFKGLAHGMSQRLRAHSGIHHKGLVRHTEELEKAAMGHYGGLRGSTTSSLTGGIDALKAGQKASKGLNLNRPLHDRNNLITD